MLPRRPAATFPQRYSQRFPHRLPQLSPQAGRSPLRGLLQGLTVAAAVAVLGGCATEIKPARPQAAPLPDTERVRTAPGATQRERIVEIARQEWQRWGGQVVRIGRDDTACVTHSPLPPPVLPSADAGGDRAEGADTASADTESDTSGDASCLRFPDGTGMEATPQGCAMAQRYWHIVGRSPDCQQITQGAWAWSAVFISWVMRKAGLDERQFLTGQSHSMYVVDARDGILPAPAFHIEPVPALPRPGDIVCAARGRDKYLENPAEIGFGTTPMHCDIVVEVDPAKREVRAIGGNVQQSVSMDVIELGDSGKLDAFTNSHMPWLLIMRNDLQ
ncbi:MULTISPECIES: DUF2272 domain-containing protein [unclassified Cupriavidus]|uniref:DUF2272 domain-containing protein n=1 Tax=unclassified Cupriavidus TaxID=2640874 RepID=UPI00313D7E1A